MRGRRDRVPLRIRDSRESEQGLDGASAVVPEPEELQELFLDRCETRGERGDRRELPDGPFDFAHPHGVIDDRPQRIKSRGGVASFDCGAREEVPGSFVGGIERDRALGRLARFFPSARRGERLREQRHRFRVAGLRFEKEHRRFGVLVLEHRPNEVAKGFLVAGTDLQRLLVHGDRLVESAAFDEHRSDDGVLHQRLVRLPDGREEIGEANRHLDVVRVHGGHLPVDGDSLARLVLFQVVVGENLVLRAGLRHESLFVVEIGERSVDVELRGIQLVDLLVDRDRLEEEAVSRVAVRDLREKADRVGRPVQQHANVAHFVENENVVGILFEEVTVFLERGIVFSPGHELVGGRQGDVPLDRHQQSSASGRTPRKVMRCSGQGPTLRRASRCSATAYPLCFSNAYAG